MFVRQSSPIGRSVFTISAQSFPSEPPIGQTAFILKQKVTDITYLRVKCKLTGNVAQSNSNPPKFTQEPGQEIILNEGFIKILLPTRSTLYTVHCTYKNDMLVSTFVEGSEATSM